ncbi:MAG TPA: VanW family protein [Blastocatellia bacterium]|nr:VanW family protein [Blastocatellia bacterium]
MNQTLRDDRFQPLRAAAPPGDQLVPSRWIAIAFAMKAGCFRTSKLLSEFIFARRPVFHSPSEVFAAQAILAKSESPLWNARALSDRPLVLGKIQNLRTALRSINGIEVPAGEVFSFWRQVGRPIRRRGFVKGRELRQGCLIATTGGGLCQLSNAIYECALAAGFEIVERHAHSRIVPGSRAEQGLDATVFWNYVDLRFRSSEPFRVEAYLTHDSLIVQFRGRRAVDAVPPFAGRTRPSGLKPVAQVVRIQDPTAKYPPTLPVHRAMEPNSCTECGVRSCFRSAKGRNPPDSGRTAFLVDGYWPEFDYYIQSVRRKTDLLLIPIGGSIFKRNTYSWTTTGFDSTRTSPALTLLRGIAIRSLPRQGAVLRSALAEWDERLARGFGRSLPPDISHLVVSQNLLPHLWRGGYLGGRTFDVLMARLPMFELERRLDYARELHPESKTIADYRAHFDLKDAEAGGLVEANQIITPHSELAALFAAKSQKLDWRRPQAAGGATVCQSRRSGSSGDSGRAVLFPAATLARKGAYEMREAARALDLEIILAGPVLEDAEFWAGVRVRPAGEKSDGESLFDGVIAACLPAFVSSAPRNLLKAISHNVPVIATSACGLEGTEGVTTIQPGDVDGLVREIQQVLLSSPSVTSSLAPTNGAPSRSFAASSIANIGLEK